MAREEGTQRYQGPSLMPGTTWSSLHTKESRGRSGPGSGRLDILGAGAASLRAERMQNQELARLQTLSSSGEPTLLPHREESVLSDRRKLEEKLTHEMGNRKVEQLNW